MERNRRKEDAENQCARYPRPYGEWVKDKTDLVVPFGNFYHPEKVITPQNGLFHAVDVRFPSRRVPLGTGEKCPARSRNGDVHIDLFRCIPVYMDGTEGAGQCPAFFLLCLGFNKRHEN